jgi:predicted phage terminase large subunit-like protein
MTKHEPIPFSVAEYQALLRTDFVSFVAWTFKVLNPHETFQYSWHLEVIAQEVAALARGETKRLILNVPPRSLKSLICSVALPAFLLGHNPGCKIIAVSYAASLAETFSRQTRTILQHPLYRALFPATRLADKQSAQTLTTTAGGARIATSIEGSITGMGADVIIVDDPQQPSQVPSEAERARLAQVLDGSLHSRLNSKAEGRILLVMQRLHEEDAVGHLEGKGTWRKLSLPAIAEEDEIHVIVTPWGRRPVVRKAGEVLHPEREPMTVLDELRAAMGPVAFAAQYQQRPTPEGGASIKAEWFKTYTDADAPKEFDTVWTSWDTANKPTELADYSVGITMGAVGKRIYILDVVRRKLAYPELKRLIIERYELFQPDKVLIENHGSGIALLQELGEEIGYRAEAIQPKGDKRMRLEGVTGYVEAGMVFLPAEAHWKADFLHELVMFPNGRHDDQVDALSQALDWRRTDGREPGVTGYYRMLFEEESRKWRLQALPGAPSHVEPCGKPTIMVPPDGIIEVDRFDAIALLRTGKWRRLE